MKIKIVGIELLAEAINNLANALTHGNKGTMLTSEVLESVVETIKPSPTISPVNNVIPLEKPPVETPALSAAERKAQIVAEIESLGFKAPEKGTVAKFEEALETARNATPQKPLEEKEKEEEEELPEVKVVVPDPEIPTNEITHDTVRAFAGAMVKANPEMGRTKLGAILKKVGAESITLATPKQLVEIVPLLEKAAGKEFA